MPGLYDRLSDQIGDADERPAGLTPLDIADLPDSQRKIMFFMLRSPLASGEGITFETLQDQFQNIEDLPGILGELTKNTWLIPLGESPNLRYKVNLRRKPGSKSSSLWSSLADRLLD